MVYILNGRVTIWFHGLRDKIENLLNNHLVCSALRFMIFTTAILLGGKYTHIRRPKMIIAILHFDCNINELIVQIHDDHK